MAGHKSSARAAARRRVGAGLRQGVSALHLEKIMSQRYGKPDGGHLDQRAIGPSGV
jgi:hypothetical protein